MQKLGGYVLIILSIIGMAGMDGMDHPRKKVLDTPELLEQILTYTIPFDKLDNVENLDEFHNALSSFEQLHVVDRNFAEIAKGLSVKIKKARKAQYDELMDKYMSEQWSFQEGDFIYLLTDPTWYRRKDIITSMSMIVSLYYDKFALGKDDEDYFFGKDYLRVWEWFFSKKIKTFNDFCPNAVSDLIKAKRSNVGNIKRLLKWGARVNTDSAESAIKANVHLDLFKILLENGAPLNISPIVIDGLLATNIDIKSQRQNKEYLNLLLAHGLKLNKSTSWWDRIRNLWPFSKKNHLSLQATYAGRQMNSYPYNRSDLIKKMHPFYNVNVKRSDNFRMRWNF